MRPITATFLHRSKLVYGLLAAVWLVTLAWQVAEHNRVKYAARAALRKSAKDITSTASHMIRSQRRWGAVIPERVESSLKELVASGDATSIALLNAPGE